MSTTDNRKDLPPVNSPNFLEKVREALSVYLGNRGDSLDQGLTRRDLLDSGVLGSAISSKVGAGMASVVDSISSTVGGELDLTPPPSPTNFKATAGVTAIMVECDDQTYTQGGGHSHSVLYGATGLASQTVTVTIAAPCVVTLPNTPVPDQRIVLSTTGALPTGVTAGTVYYAVSISGVTCRLSLTKGGSAIHTSGTQSGVHTASFTPVFSNAVPLAEFQGNVFTYSTNPATTWHLWLKWVTFDGVESATPAGGTNGVVATTAQDVGLLLDAIKGKITASQLYADLGARIDLIDAPGTGLVTTVTNISGTLATEVSTVTTLSATVGGHTSSIATEVGTRATETGNLFSKYTVKIDTNGYVTGFGLASTANDATPYSEFGVRADKFYVASPTGPGITPTFPFTVVTTAIGTPGTSGYIPVGVYINGAVIKGGTIDGAAIVGGTIEKTKLMGDISFTDLQGGSLSASTWVGSTNYASSGGTLGWRINADGTAHLNNAYLSGEIHATAGQIGGNTIGASGLQSPGYPTTGWRLDSSGDFQAKSGAFSGSLSGATITGASGTFAGSLTGATITGATGTFSGALAAGTVDFASSVGTTVAHTVVGSHTLTVPAGMTRMRLSFRGGGGGGGAGGLLGAGGGTGGAYPVLYQTTVTVSPGASYTLVIGAGGAGGTLNGNAGSTGDSTYITGILTAYGGAGGAAGGALDANTYGGEDWVGGTGYGPSGGAGANHYSSGFVAATVGTAGTASGGGGGKGAMNDDWSRTSAGAAGGCGNAVIEYFDPTGVVLKADLDALKTQLNAATSFPLSLT